MLYCINISKILELLNMILLHFNRKLDYYVIKLEQECLLRIASPIYHYLNDHSVILVLLLSSVVNSST